VGSRLPAQNERIACTPVLSVNARATDLDTSPRHRRGPVPIESRQHPCRGTDEEFVVDEEQTRRGLPIDPGDVGRPVEPDGTDDVALGAEVSVEEPRLAGQREIETPTIAVVEHAGDVRQLVGEVGQAVEVDRLRRPEGRPVVRADLERAVRHPRVELAVNLEGTSQVAPGDSARSDRRARDIVAVETAADDIVESGTGRPPQ